MSQTVTIRVMVTTSRGSAKWVIMETRNGVEKSDAPDVLAAFRTANPWIDPHYIHAEWVDRVTLE